MGMRQAELRWLKPLTAEAALALIEKLASAISHL